MEYTYRHVRRSSRSNNGVREPYKSSCCHSFIQKDKCFNRFFCQWNHNALPLLYAMFVFISMLMPINVTAETTTELPDESTKFYTTATAIINELNSTNPVYTKSLTLSEDNHYENEVNLMEVSSEDTTVEKSFSNDLEINDVIYDAANTIENDTNVDANFDVNDNGEISNLESEVSTKKYDLLPDFDRAFSEEGEKMEDVRDSRKVKDNIDNNLDVPEVTIDSSENMLVGKIFADHLNEITTMRPSASQSESENNKVTKENVIENTVTEVLQPAESAVEADNSHKFVDIDKSQNAAELELNKSVSGQKDNNSEILLAPIDTYDSKSITNNSKSSEEIMKIANLQTDDDSPSDSALPTHFQINENEDDTDEYHDATTTHSLIISTTVSSIPEIPDQSVLPTAEDSLQDLLAVELPIEINEEEANQSKHTEESEHNIIKKPGVVIDDQMLEALESNANSEQPILIKETLPITTEPNVKSAPENDVVRTESAEIAPTQFEETTLSQPEDLPEDTATTTQSPADETTEEHVEHKLTTELYVEDHNEEVAATTELITSKGLRSVYTADTVGATLHETYQPHVAGQTFNDNLADERVADIGKSSRAQSVQQASMSTYSIVIAVISCIALMLLLIVGTIFVISFRRQHGTLDIEMSEQKCGKYNQDDGEEGDTFMKLLDVELPRSTILMIAEEAAMASVDHTDDEECL